MNRDIVTKIVLKYNKTQTKQNGANSKKTFTHGNGEAVNVGKIVTKTRIPSVDNATVQPFFIYSPEKECELLRTESAQLDDAPSTDFASEHDATAGAVPMATRNRQEK